MSLRASFIKHICHQLGSVWLQGHGKSICDYVRKLRLYNMLFGFFCGCRDFCYRTESDLFLFIRPSSDGMYYGMVMSVRPGLRPSDSPSVRLSVRPSGSPSARFPHFSPTCFDILSWNFAYHYVLMYYRSRSSVVTLQQFWRSYASFWT